MVVVARKRCYREDGWNGVDSLWWSAEACLCLGC